MKYVLDASFIGAVIIPDEKNMYADTIYMKINKNDVKCVPGVFSYEIANIFMNLIRRKRHTYDEVLRLFSILSAIEITIDHETGIEYSQKLLRLCKDYNLSTYDAAYLELAARKNATLCTLDDGLRAAAKKYGVAVLE